MFNKIFGRRTQSELHSDRWIFGVMLVFGLFGLLSAFVLTVEKIHLLENPNAILSCSFNIVLNCATVMQTWQSHVFGFPNSIIGIIGYSIVVTLAMAGLSGARFSRWFLITANIFYFLGAIFAYWLFFQSVYVIQVLCPWCLVVTFSTTLVLAALTHYNLRVNTFGFSKALDKKIQDILFSDYDKLAVAIWIVLLVSMVFLKFGDALFA
jgi:uncharacterized membrane protein